MAKGIIENKSNYTLPQKLSPSSTFLKDRDGNVYRTVQIGKQLWTIENWKCTKYNDGSAIPLVLDSVGWTNNTTGAMCYYDNKVSNKSIYGALYNWYAVNTGKLAPQGWRVPTAADWKKLENYLIANRYNYDHTRTECKIAKSMAEVNNLNAPWVTYDFDFASGIIGDKFSHAEQNNITNFSALPGGFRELQVFRCLGFFSAWWTSTQEDAVHAQQTLLSSIRDELSLSFMYKTMGLSVRLVKDL